MKRAQQAEVANQDLRPVHSNIAHLLRVRQCDSDRCTWLFVDLSKNQSRRWCKMADCGNRAKARRFYERTRS